MPIAACHVKTEELQIITEQQNAVLIKLHCQPRQPFQRETVPSPSGLLPAPSPFCFVPSPFPLTVTDEPSEVDPTLLVPFACSCDKGSGREKPQPIAPYRPRATPLPTVAPQISWPKSHPNFCDTCVTRMHEGFGGGASSGKTLTRS